MTAEIERVRLEIEDLSSEVTRLELDQFNLGRQRALELSRLKATRGLELGGLQALRENRLGAFSREKNLQLESLALEKNTASSTLGLISKQFENVRLARSEREPDVKIGALAMRPEVPIPRGTNDQDGARFDSGFFAGRIRCRDRGSGLRRSPGRELSQRP